MKRFVAGLVALFLLVSFIPISEARYYDANTGRFISEDPVGFQGGDVNLYAYVRNNPINGVDPSGLVVIADDLLLIGGTALVLGTAAYLQSPAGKKAISGIYNSIGTIFVDPYGNAIPTPVGGSITGSPDGRWIQGRDADGNPTGVRIDAGHDSHSDPRAQDPHAHVPGVANPDGTPWLPVNSGSQFSPCNK